MKKQRSSPRDTGATPAATPDVELRHWRQFVTLAQTLHFGRAAQLLNMTQPPLTQAIQLLEQRLGARLFERGRGGVALTAVGTTLLEPAQRLLAQSDALRQQARAAADGGQGRIRLGFVSTVGFGPLPAWLRRFRDACPGIQIELIEATGEAQQRAVERSELDCGFVLHAAGHGAQALQAVADAVRSGAGLERLSVGVEPMVLALPDVAPWTGTGRLQPADWMSQPLVIFPRSAAPSLYDAVLAFYHRHANSATIAQEAIQMQTIVNLVSAGIGLALVPRSVMQLRRPGVIYRELPATPAVRAPQCETSLWWSAAPAPAVRRFVDFVRDMLSGPDLDTAAVSFALNLAQ